MRCFLSLLAVSCLINYGTAQFPPAREGVTELKSKFHPGVTISYKNPGICETTEGVKSYSGYVHLPPNTVDEVGESQNYPINTFFWFFESRKDPHNAPLSIWLNGGPGGSSMMGALAENGPCFIGHDSNSTYLNPWSWNNDVNMLYIDQPVQVGFSYDTPTNITVDFLKDGNITVTDFSNGIPQQNLTFLVGTSASQNMTHAPNTTTHAAHAIWHFAQTFFEEFPFYKPHDEKINLWTESYGGKYGPAFTTFFSEQNEKIANGTISTPGAHYLHLDTLGIINGCIDSFRQGLSYATFPFNNTYGIQAINETQWHQNVWEFNRPGGAKDMISKCQNISQILDPDRRGNNEEVNQVCRAVREEWSLITGSYLGSKKYGWYDITHPAADPFPGNYYVGFLNQHWVQHALGVPVNFSAHGRAVSEDFAATGDFGRGGMLEDIAYVLESGIKVTMVYGDRDYACNWVGGQESSLNIPYSSIDSFRNAGYTPIEVTPVYSGGQVRQYGNFSFSRIYQSGHLVPSYQPETAYKIFMRSLFNKDIATGRVDLSDDYVTTGTASTWHIKNDVLSAPEPVCYVLAPATCSESQYEMVKNNTAVIKNYVLVGKMDKDGGQVVDKTYEPSRDAGQQVLGGRG